MTPPVTFYTMEGKGKSSRIAEAFCSNVKAEVSHGDRGLLPGLAVFYGVDNKTLPLFFQASKENRAYYIDNGYFSPGSNGYYRVTGDRLQSTGIPRTKSGRFSTHGIAIQPWRLHDRGEYLLVTLQTESFYDKFCDWGSRVEWIARVVDEVAQVSGRPLVFRDKPRSKSAEVGELQKAIQGAWAVITFTSNTAVEAALAGIPVFCTHPCAATWMGSPLLNQVETPWFPADPTRLEICDTLAANQWSLDEIRSGACWDDLMRLRSPREW